MFDNVFITITTYYAGIKQAGCFFYINIVLGQDKVIVP